MLYTVDANAIEVCTDTTDQIASAQTAEALSAGTWAKPAELTEVSVEINGNVEEWTAFGNGGWGSALKTGQTGKITLKGKRVHGDAGNDAIADTQYKVGADAYLGVRITHPDGSKITFLTVCNVKSAGASGKATDVEPLEAECTTHGKPHVE